jgi:methyl-accepting chemotaxis protein
MNLSNLKISTRLILGFGIVLAGALLLAGAGWVGLHRQSAVAHAVVEQDVQFLRAVSSIRTRVQTLRRFEKDSLLNVARPEKVKEYRQKWEESRKRIDELLLQARATAVTAEETKRLDLLGRSLAQYASSMAPVEEALLSGAITSSEAGYHRVEEFRQVIRDTEEVTQELFDDASRRIEAARPVLAGIEHDVTFALISVAVIVMALAAFIALLISRSIIVPVGEAVRVAEALAKGDLTQKVETGSKDEIGRLMHALKGTVGQLASIVGRIKETSDMVGTASREIAQGNTDLSTRTEEQASALEETSASMQQMTATVGQNAQNAKKVNELAAQASGVAAKGGEVVREAVGTMNGITQSSKKIADIIGVIDGIAFQTNILALNAAVEAARAGEQGRGFAVVASEVRSLAQRSAAAAKEIKDLITDSVSKVDAGSRQVNDAGRTMEEIVASVKKVTTLISEITAASQEQAQGIEQVSETMTQLEKVTQQNAAMVEEASAAAGSLEEQSRELASAVGAFTLAEQHGLVAPAPKHAAPKAAERKPAEKSESKKRAEVKTPHIHTLAAKVSAKKGNGHLEEGWQEF